VTGSTAIELSPEATTLLAVAAEPVRWELLRALSQGPRCVCDLRPAVPAGAPALSHHRKVLREAGLVTAARRGTWIDYALAPDAFERPAALPVEPVGDESRRARSCTS
jgi:ArsR family transcriptional regulator, arsenate/arsenite/antimonite-responsive transcriptional repressor